MHRPLCLAFLFLFFVSACAGSATQRQRSYFPAGEDPITEALIDLDISPRPGRLGKSEDGTPLLYLQTADGDVIFMVEPALPKAASCAQLKRPETVEWWFFQGPDPILLQLTADLIRFYRWDPEQSCLVSWPAWEPIPIEGEELLTLSLSYEEGVETPLQELVQGADVLPWPGEERIRLSFGMLEISGEDGTRLLAQPLLADEDYCSKVSASFMRNAANQSTIRVFSSDGNRCMFQDDERDTSSTVEFVWSELDDRLEAQLQRSEETLVAKTWSGMQRARSVSFKQSYPGLFGRVDNWSSRDLATWEWEEELDQKIPCTNEQGVESITVKTCSTSGNNTAQAVSWTYSDFEGRSWDLARFEWQQPLHEKVECRTICGY
ncbi:MAG: hypothetical protein RBU37_10260 [Myxococcota bacterium]|jgi:hypothetical protein|nr:hypothetical protein [Myxococcota bacterium]